MVKNNRLRTPNGYKLVGKSIPNSSNGTCNLIIDGKVQYPEQIIKQEEDYLMHMYQDGNIESLETLEELPDDYEPSQY